MSGEVKKVGFGTFFLLFLVYIAAFILVSIVIPIGIFLAWLGVPGFETISDDDRVDG